MLRASFLLGGEGASSIWGHSKMPKARRPRWSGHGFEVAWMVGRQWVRVESRVFKQTARATLGRGYRPQNRY